MVLHLGLVCGRFWPKWVTSYVRFVYLFMVWDLLLVQLFSNSFCFLLQGGESNWRFLPKDFVIHWNSPIRFTRARRYGICIFKNNEAINTIAYVVQQDTQLLLWLNIYSQYVWQLDMFRTYRSILRSIYKLCAAGLACEDCVLLGASIR